MTSHFKRFPSRLAVAYTLDGKRYHGFSEDFTILSTETNGPTTRMTGLLRDALTVTVEVTSYEGYDAVCWRVTFANNTEEPSATLEETAPDEEPPAEDAPSEDTSDEPVQAP